MKKARFVYPLLAALLLLAGCSSEKTVRSGDLKITLSDAGQIAAMSFKGKPAEAVSGEVSLEGCDIKTLSARKIRKGWEFSKEVTSPQGSALITERFFATDNSIRWEVTVLGGETPWSTPIQTVLRYGAPGARVWAPWGGPQIDPAQVEDEALREKLILMPGSDNGWVNALLEVPFSDATYYFGSPYVTNENPQIAYCPEYKDLLSIPMATVVDPALGRGLTLALSLQDTIQDIDLRTQADGTLTFSRRYHRIVDSNPVHLSVDLIAHAPDWRGGAAWMVERYPEYFYPTMEQAFELNGTSAYASNHDMGFDVQKMKDMAFSTNWRASFDFPYMGMFIPPVKDPQTKWFTYRQDSVCVAEMNAYAERMHEAGFHVLNYFNLNEFGNGIIYPAPAPAATDPEQLWKNPNDYLYQVLSEAILPVPQEMAVEGCYYPQTTRGGMFYTWGDGIVVDCGVPVYKEFLLEQTRKHLAWLPATDGFCIDRFDWWHYFNEKYDDGISWYEGKPARSLRVSLLEFMKEFAPMVHEAGKVIFINTHAKRIDLLKDADGIHDEYTTTEGALNTTAFLAFKKPALGWTWNNKTMHSLGVDNFFQKFLYMGVFPMCPFPGNDHSIRPDEWTDRAYLDYGPLMQQMKYRRWVLSPDPVQVVEGTAKANIFEIPEGYIVPVVYAAADEVIGLSLPAVDASRAWKAEAFYPGEKQPVLLEMGSSGKTLTLDVPVRRGCAMVRLSR